MNSVLSLVAFAALVSARPEAGYNYPQPGQGQLPSSDSISVENPFIARSQGGQTFNAGNFIQGQLSNNAQQSGFSGFNGNNAGFSAQSVSSSFRNVNSGSARFSDNLQGIAVDAAQSPISQGGSGVIVHKHIYVHAAPEEPQEFIPRKPIHVAAPQKHYKIIFVKAPTAPTPTAPVIPVQPQDEEKTIVYVLVKKPEQGPEIVIPTPAPTQPAKPEVYFIKYKAQKEGASGSSAGFSSGGSLGLSAGGSSGFSTGGSLGLSAGGSSAGFSSGGSLGLSAGSSSGFSTGSSFGVSAGGSSSGIATGLSSVSSGVAPKYGPPSH